MQGSILAFLERLLACYEERNYQLRSLLETQPEYEPFIQIEDMLRSGKLEKYMLKYIREFPREKIDDSKFREMKQSLTELDKKYPAMGVYKIITDRCSAAFARCCFFHPSSDPGQGSHFDQLRSLYDYFGTHGLLHEVSALFAETQGALFSELISLISLIKKSPSSHWQEQHLLISGLCNLYFSLMYSGEELSQFLSCRPAYVKELNLSNSLWRVVLRKVCLAYLQKPEKIVIPTSMETSNNSIFNDVVFEVASSIFVLPSPDARLLLLRLLQKLKMEDQDLRMLTWRMLVNDITSDGIPNAEEMRELLKYSTSNLGVYNQLMQRLKATYSQNQTNSHANTEQPLTEASSEKSSDSLKLQRSNSQLVGSSSTKSEPVETTEPPTSYQRSQPVQPQTWASSVHGVFKEIPSAKLRDAKPPTSRTKKPDFKVPFLGKTYNPCGSTKHRSGSQQPTIITNISKQR